MDDLTKLLSAIDPRLTSFIKPNPATPSPPRDISALGSVFHTTFTSFLRNRGWRRGPMGGWRNGHPAEYDMSNAVVIELARPH